MAEARRIVHAVPDDIVLTLTLKEAKALKQVCFSVGGTPLGSARMYFDDISEALAKAKVGCAEHKMLSSQSTIFYTDEEVSK